MFKNTGRCFVFQITLFSKKLSPALRDRSTSEGIVFLEISIDANKFSLTTRSHFKIQQTKLENLY